VSDWNCSKHEITSDRRPAFMRRVPTKGRPGTRVGRITEKIGSMDEAHQIGRGVMDLEHIGQTGIPAEGMVVVKGGPPKRITA